VHNMIQRVGFMGILLCASVCQLVTIFLSSFGSGTWLPLLCVCMCILPGKAVPEMTYTVSSGTLNPTHSLTLVMVRCWSRV